MTDSTQLAFARSAHDGCRWCGEAVAAEQATGSHPGGLSHPEGERRFTSAPWSAFVLLALVLSGCGVSTRPLTLVLRDADSKQLLENAGVEADSLALGPSLSPGDVIDELLGKRAAFSSRALTNIAGRVTLEVVPGRQVRLTVLRTGSTAVSQMLERNINKNEYWQESSHPPETPGAFQVKVRFPSEPSER